MANISIEKIYPKPEKLLLLLEKNKEDVFKEAVEIVKEKFFNGEDVKDKKILCEFLALEIINVDNEYAINEDRLEYFKDPKTINNNWLKWSLSLNRDVRDLNLANSGIEVLSTDELKKLHSHKTKFAKSYNIDLKTDDIDMLYYKLYNVLRNEELGTFYKYYDKFKALGDNVLKTIYVKPLESMDQINFYLEAIREKEKNNLDTKGFNFLLAINYKYIEEFKKHDLNLIKLLNKNVIPENDFIYKMINYATNDKDLISLLKGFTQISPGSFLKTIDPRESIEDQSRASSGSSIVYKDEDESKKPYVIGNDGDYMRVYTPTEALKKLYNEYTDMKLSPKLKLKDDEFKFNLDKLNIPYVNGEYNGYKYETHALLTHDGYVNSGLLVRGIIDKDCSSSFKDNYLMGYECIENLVAYPENNVYVVCKDQKGADIASLYVTRSADTLIIDSIQYMKNLGGMNEEEASRNFHSSLIPLIHNWAADVVRNDKGISKILFGEGHDGLRLTPGIKDQIGARINKISKSAQGKENGFLLETIAPYSPGVYNDLEDSNKIRLIYTTDPRFVSFKKVREQNLKVLENVPNNEDLKERMEESLKLMKKLDNKREEYGFTDNYNIQGGIFRDEDSLKSGEEFINNKFYNESLYDVNIDINDIGDR